MSKAATAPISGIFDAELSVNREGPRLDIFKERLEAMKTGQAFDIPTRKNAKGKTVPQYGFNVKAVNQLYSPKVFRKRHMTNKDGVEVVRVFCVNDGTKAADAAAE